MTIAQSIAQTIANLTAPAASTAIGGKSLRLSEAELFILNHALEVAREQYAAKSVELWKIPGQHRLAEEFDLKVEAVASLLNNING